MSENFKPDPFNAVTLSRGRRLPRSGATHALILSPYAHCCAVKSAEVTV